ncbi:hypothetical protein [Micromonospora gifhornensis]|uniref:hypothetical protein n=1 Tax=Micromonospora gifhornensis TaxID=84594 RepID=UPI00364DD218
MPAAIVQITSGVNSGAPTSAAAAPATTPTANDHSARLTDSRRPSAGRPDRCSTHSAFRINRVEQRKPGAITGSGCAKVASRRRSTLEGGSRLVPHTMLDRARLSPSGAPMRRPAAGQSHPAVALTGEVPSRRLAGQ